MSLQLRVSRVPALFSEGCEGDGADNDNYADLLAAPKNGRQARRDMLLQESLAQRAARLARALARALDPKCLAAIGPAFDLLWRERSIRPVGLPDPEHALALPDGLAGLAEDLSAGALAAAYAKGLHARCLMGPATYWAPAQRLAQHPAQLRLDGDLRSLLRRGDYDIAFDRDFDGLMTALAAPSPGQLRLNPRLLRAYAGLFDAGLAHCFEVRDRKGRLAGAGFGVAIGQAFVMERIVSAQPNAARLGLTALARHLDAWGYRLLDVSFIAHLAGGMNFETLARAKYNRRLESCAGGGRPGLWRIDPKIYAARSAPAGMRHLFDPPPPPHLEETAVG